VHLFLDTSALYALADPGDQHHTAAASFWREVEDGDGERIVLSNFILHELAILLRRRLGQAVALRVLDGVAESRAIQVVRIDPDLEDEAWRIFRAREREVLSFTDCTSCALMRREGLRQAFTFDEHFRMFGFEMLPARS
jgi:predicted nucleic acid-binding protein